MTLVFDLIYLLVVCLGWPFLLVRRLRRGPGSLALGERLGNVPSRPVGSRCVWIHGVSLGEINATRTIVDELRARDPAIVIAISSTTATGLARARDLYGARHVVFRFPLDFSFTIRRVLRRVRPSAIVLMELETWPNLIRVAEARGVPVLIANGRVTEEKSMRLFGKPVIRGIARGMFSRLSWIGAQDAAYAERFIRLGAPPERVEVVGSVKYDAAEVGDSVAGQEQLAAELSLDPGKPLLVCGSTGPGEEDALLRVYKGLLAEYEDLQLALIPRKPERFDEVARLIAQHGFACLRRSGAPPVVPRDVPAPRPVFLGDTLGELRKFYALATVVFVGRTLVPLGGSDLMEIAALAKPIVVGPYTQNFTEATDALLATGGAVRVRDERECHDAIRRFIRNPHAAGATGRAARQVILARRGATQRTVERILAICSEAERSVPAASQYDMTP